MKGKSVPAVVIVAVSLAVSGSMARAAQDKYTVKVPNGLAFSEFRGYEGWQTISVSHNDKVMAVILGNPVMINAYQSGIPGNGKPSLTAPRWRRFTGCRRRWKHSQRRRCRQASRTSTSW